MMAAPITASQIRAIHTALNVNGIEDEDYRALLAAQFKVTTCKALTRAEAGQLLNRLWGRKRAPANPAGGSRKKSRRRQHIRQPASAPPPDNGTVVRLVSLPQRRLIEALVSEIAWEQADGYARWLNRSLGLTAVRTTAEAARVINGLQGLKQFGHGQEA